MYNFQPRKKSKKIEDSKNIHSSQQSQSSNQYQNSNQNLKISTKEQNYNNINELNNSKYRKQNNSDLPMGEMHSIETQKYSNKIDTDTDTYMNQKIAIMSLTQKSKPVIIEIEYEKILNNKKGVSCDENGNYNVYFMKPVFKSKKVYNNQYKDDNNNIIKEETEYEQNNSDVIPLEIIHRNNEKKFKAHLVQKLKTFKIKQAENSRIPLNLASKAKREEKFRNSLKHLLAMEAEPIDRKKELMYYKGYFRFWKKNVKISEIRELEEE